MSNEVRPWLENYLHSGRRFETLEVASLTQAWFEAGSRARNARSGEEFALAMDDIEADFNLRGLDAPGPRRH
jgi:hypothetical protein